MMRETDGSQRADFTAATGYRGIHRIGGGKHGSHGQETGDDKCDSSYINNYIQLDLNRAATEFAETMQVFAGHRCELYPYDAGCMAP